MGLHSLTANVLTADRTFLPGPEGRRIDLGSVGQVRSVNARLLHLLVQAGSIPCVATIARDAAGQRLHVNADATAAAIAAAMGADKFVVVNDTPGIRAGPDESDGSLDGSTIAQIDEMIRCGAIDRRVLPKVEACVHAVRGGVGKAHIIDGRIPHALLLEIYTDAGIGTQIAASRGA